jgi:hypothetical protein
MQRDELKALAERVESADEASTALVSEVAGALAASYPGIASRAVPDAALLCSTDAALHVADGAIPGWEISLRGMALEPHGHWHCSLRETSATDDDAEIGFGEAPSLPRALIAALLRIAAMRTGD